MNDKGLPLWRLELERALQAHHGIPESRYCQLATVDDDQLPTVRTIVYRGFEQNSGSLIIHTDKRSEKVSHLVNSPKAQLCWYFPRTREQFRMSADINVIGHSDEHHQHLLQSQWDALSDAAKRSYFGETPGAVLALNDEYQASVVSNEDLSHPNKCFTLLLLSITKVEHLQLTTSPHTRRVFEAKNSEEWQMLKVNP